MVKKGENGNLADAKVYTVTQAAEVLGIGRNEAYRLARDGKIPSLRVSERRVIIPIAVLDDWLREKSSLTR